ncbi:MAG: CHC2 zinc finger domain-containing protein [Bryobacteraceae bacterium]
MSSFLDGFIQQVKAAAASQIPTLAERAGFRWPARGEGRGRKMHCSFHADKTPSAHLYDDRIHCFGCTQSWDVIDLEQLVGGGTFSDALNRLAARYGIEAEPTDVHVAVRPRFDTETLAEAALFHTGLRWHLERRLEAAKLPLLGEGEVDGEAIYGLTQLLCDVQRWTEHEAAEAFADLRMKEPDFVAERIAEAEDAQSLLMHALYLAGQTAKRVA